MEKGLYKYENKPVFASRTFLKQASIRLEGTMFLSNTEVPSYITTLHVACILFLKNM